MRPLLLCTLIVCRCFAAQLNPDSTEQARLQKLNADLLVLNDKSKLTMQYKQQLADEIMALTEKGHQPKRSSVQKFTGDLAGALAGKSITKDKVVRLIDDVYKVL